ncbi:UNVERIFIED_CONTAM: hypothetical protein K2H54_039855 [Gekko kuhli]
MRSLFLSWLQRRAGDLAVCFPVSGLALAFVGGWRNTAMWWGLHPLPRTCLSPTAASSTAQQHKTYKLFVPSVSAPAVGVKPDFSAGSTLTKVPPGSPAAPHPPYIKRNNCSWQPYSEVNVLLASLLGGGSSNTAT